MSSRKHIHTPANVGEQISDAVTSFFGSWLCIILHTIWFAVWLLLRFDINLLTMIVSLEAIFLSTLVMISQNRQSDKDRKRDDLEAYEIERIFASHELLLTINQQQLEILQLLRNGKANEETKVCDDGQAQERSNSAIGRSSEDEGRARSEADEVGVPLASYLAQMPDHPLARETEKWITSMGKCLADVIWWDIRDGAMAALYLRKAHVSVQFAGSETRHFYTFPYDEREMSK